MRRRRTTTRPWGQRLPVTPDGTLTVGANQIVSAFEAGFTFTHHEYASDINATTKGYLADTCVYLNQHILSFGANVDPTTAPGVYNWSALDTRFGYKAGGPSGPNDFAGQANGWMSSIGSGKCVATIFGIPTYMRTATNGDYTAKALTDPTDWQLGTPGADVNDLDADYAPHYTHWDDLANFVVAFLQRYPHIGVIQIGNEFKGWFSKLLNRWWYEGYTRHFNKIQAAVQAAKNAGTIRSDLKIGGPYLVWSTYSWDGSTTGGIWADNGEADPLDRFEINNAYGDKRVLRAYRYWAANATGCDLLMVDPKNNDKDYEAKDYKPILATASKTWPWPTSYRWAENPWTSCQKFQKIKDWFNTAAAADANLRRPQCDLGTLPVWYSEVYLNPLKEEALMADGIALSSSQEMLAVYAWGLIDAIHAGVNGYLLWRPQGDQATDRANPLGLWVENGDAATILHPLLSSIKTNFSNGQQIKTVTTDHTLVRGIATATKILVASRAATPLLINVNGTNRTLAAYDVQTYTI